MLRTDAGHGLVVLTVTEAEIRRLIEEHVRTLVGQENIQQIRWQLAPDVMATVPWEAQGANPRRAGYVSAVVVVPKAAADAMPRARQ